jgi:hypothetical protein
MTILYVNRNLHVLLILGGKLTLTAFEFDRDRLGGTDAARSEPEEFYDNYQVLMKSSTIKKTFNSQFNQNIHLVKIIHFVSHPAPYLSH